MNIKKYLSKIKEKSSSFSLIKFCCIFAPLLALLILFINKLDMNSDLSKIITVVITIIISFIIVHFFTDDDSYIHEKLGVIEEEDNGFYKAYLDVMIDSLNVANTQIQNVKVLVEYKNIDLLPYLKRVEGVYIHLSRLSPPNMYQEYHDDILLELKTFLDEYTIKK